MGIAVPSQLLGRQHLFQSTMKAFAAAALVATASAAPEAKPWLVHPAAIPAVLPGDLTAHATSGELVTLPNGAQVPDTTLSVKAAAPDHLAAKSAAYGLWGYGKRSADAEAKPYYGLGYGYAGYGYAPAALIAHPNGAVTPPYTLAQQVAAADHFAAKFGKRSADADAWYGLGYRGYGYTTPYAGYAYLG